MVSILYHKKKIQIFLLLFSLFMHFSNYFLFQSVWERLEKNHKKIYKGIFPNCVKTLLISSGFDTNSSLYNLNENTIVGIEQYFSTNKDEIAQLNCCYSDEYKKLDKFQFLPGHKTLILAIPSMLDVSNKLSKKKIMLSDQELKNELVKKLMTTLTTAARKVGISIPAGTISEANLIQFHRPTHGPTNEKNIVCQCKFSCPFCAKNYTIKYKTYWQTNNASTHLKNAHMKSNDQNDNHDDNA